ncbi:MAG: SulP family inorganic anion transporter [Bacteroidota bacterium]
MKNFFDFRYFRKDLLGGITAGIVALPLALAFGEQSGMGAAAGLYGAAFIAFFAALFGGTATQISGPTAPMTALSMVIVAGLLQAAEGQLDQAIPLILMVFLLAGIIQIGLGIVKVGTFIKYIPYTVVSGFMTGIGVIILITQLLPALGYNSGNDTKVIDTFKPNAEQLLLNRILEEEAEDGMLVLEEFKGTIDRANEVSEEAIKTEAQMLATNASKGVIGSLTYLPRAFGNINLIELLLTLITIAVIYGFKRITSTIPSTLVALVVVAGGAYALGLEYILIREIPTGFPKFYVEVFTEFDLGLVSPFIISAFLLAFLGAIDSLLTSVVADNLTKTQHKPNQELIGQGIGNSIAALFGGLPGAGATIRTVVNIQAGGKTKFSGMIAGMLLFVILILLGPIASNIPAAVLAGILITVGIGVMDYKGLRALPKMEMSERIILLTVLILTVFWQLVYAVAVGLVMAALVFLKRVSDTSENQLVITDLNKLQGEEPLWSDELTIDPEIREKVVFKHLDGPLFFGFVSAFRENVAELSDLHLLVIRMEKVPFMDQSGIYALEAAVDDLHEREVVVVLSGVNEETVALMKDMNITPDMIPERHIFQNFEDCKVWLAEFLTKENGWKEELAQLK